MKSIIPELKDNISLNLEYKVFFETFGERALVLALELYENYERNRRQEIFEWAAYNGHDKVVEILLTDERVDPSGDDDYVIRWAAKKGHDKVVEILLKDERVDPTTNKNEAVRYAAKNGHDKVVKILSKDERVDPSDFSNFAIREAAFYGHEKVVKKLLKDPRVDPRAVFDEPLRVATQQGHVGIVELLLKDPRVIMSEKEKNEIMRDVRWKYGEVVRDFLEKGRINHGTESICKKLKRLKDN